MGPQRIKVGKYTRPNVPMDPMCLKTYEYLREPQHTPVSHTPDIPFHTQMKGIPTHKLLVGGLGDAKQGSVGKFLENIIQHQFKV